MRSAARHSRRRPRLRTRGDPRAIPDELGPSHLRRRSGRNRTGFASRCSEPSWAPGPETVVSGSVQGDVGGSHGRPDREGAPGCLRAKGVGSISVEDRTERRTSSASERASEIRRGPGPPGFPAQKRVFLGGRHAGFLTCRPGRGSKPHSGSGSIRLRALLDGQGNSSHRRSGLASGETAVSSYPDGTSGAPPSPYHRAVSLLLRSSDSRPSGSHPTPCSPKWGLSSAAGRCRRGPPSAALHLLAETRIQGESK